MGFRGFIKDIIFLYLGYRLIRIWLFDDELTTGIGLLTSLLLLVTIWFMFERVGILPRMG